MNSFWTAAGVVVSLVIGVAGIVTSVIALWQTGKANKLAQDANGAVEESNRIARESRDAADAANGLAAEANKISRDANTVSERALAATTDQTVYDWGFEFDYQTSTIKLTNDSPNLARDMSAVVRYKDRTIVEGSCNELAPFAQLTLQTDFLHEQIAENRRNIQRNNAQGGVFVISSGAIDVEVSLAWTSELGLKRSQKLQESCR